MTISGWVYFICPDVRKPSGGVAKIYEFAAALRKVGRSVAVLHQKKEYQPSWFYTDVPVLSVRDVVLNSSDILVVPEFMCYMLPQLGGCAKVVLRQAWYVPEQDKIDYNQVCCILTTSNYIDRYTRYELPGLPVFQIRLGYDPVIFNPVGAIKSRKIAYMPRRRSDYAKIIIRNLESRGVLNGWSVVPIDGLPVDQVAKIMREALIFLSFGQREGFGMPPLEAMACGCLTIGFHGHGGAEFFDPAYSYPILEDDICSFQETLEQVLSDENVEAKCKYMGELAAQAVAKKYRLDYQDQDIVKAIDLSKNLALGLEGIVDTSLKKVKFKKRVRELTAFKLTQKIRLFFGW